MTDETRLAFVISHEAWYWKAAKPPETVYEIDVQRRYDGGGVEWEFSVVWERLGTPELCMCLRIWDDAFEAFIDIPAFFVALAELRAPTPGPDVIAGLLLSLGFEDVTERRRS